MNPRNPHIADIFAGLLVLFLAAWFAPDVTPGEAAYPQDSHYYLKTAQNIYNGVGYSGHDRLAEGQIWTDPEVMRGPLYPLTMAAAFSVMGYGMDTALALGSVLFVANAVVLFLLGRVLFGWRVGLLASLYLMFSSLTLFAGSVVMLDSLLALLSLLTFLFYFLAARENRALYFVLAGLSFGLAYLTKELALLYLGLPFALIVLERSHGIRASLRGAGIYYATALVTISPWLVIAVLDAGTLQSVMGRAIPAALGLNDLYSDFYKEGVLPSTEQSGPGLWAVLSGRIQEIFPYAILVLASWLWMAGRHARLRQPADGFTLALLLLFAPFLFYLTKSDLRPTQALTFYHFGALVLAVMVVDAGRLITRYRNIASIISAALVIGVAYYAIGSIETPTWARPLEIYETLALGLITVIAAPTAWAVAQLINRGVRPMVLVSSGLILLITWFTVDEALNEWVIRRMFRLPSEPREPAMAAITESVSVLVLGVTLLVMLAVRRFRAGTQIILFACLTLYAKFQYDAPLRALIEQGAAVSSRVEHGRMIWAPERARDSLETAQHLRTLKGSAAQILTNRRNDKLLLDFLIDPAPPLSLVEQRTYILEPRPLSLWGTLTSDDYRPLLPLLDVASNWSTDTTTQYIERFTPPTDNAPVIPMLARGAGIYRLDGPDHRPLVVGQHHHRALQSPCMVWALNPPIDLSSREFLFATDERSIREQAAAGSRWLVVDRSAADFGRFLAAAKSLQPAWTSANGHFALYRVNPAAHAGEEGTPCTTPPPGDMHARAAPRPQRATVRLIWRQIQQGAQPGCSTSSPAPRRWPGCPSGETPAR